MVDVMTPEVVVCPYCDKPADLTSSKDVYRGKDYGPIYLCKCQPGWSYVGVHEGTLRPLGRLANKELREWKKTTHSAFDPLWRDSKTMKRSEAYAWLSEAMDIPPEQCHIGMFNVKQCKRAVTACMKKGMS